MRLRHIELFHAILLTGSVSAAARMLHVTQPAASRTLRHAELQLGFALFERTGGRLQPTPEALALQPQVERLFAQLDDVQRLAASLRAGRGQGTLRVLSVPSLGQEVFPHAVQLWREQHPGVLLQHRTLHTPQILAALALQEADAGYAFNAPPHPALAQERLAERPMACVAPRGLLPAAALRAGAIGLQALAGLPLIALDGGDPLGTLLERRLREQDTLARPVMTVQTYHVALALAERGVGVALVEGCTAAAADRSRVDVLPLSPPIGASVHALWASTRPPSLAAQAFTRCMRQALQQLPPT